MSLFFSAAGLFAAINTAVGPSITIQGAVNQPGQHPLGEMRSLSSVLQTGGGVAKDANLRTVTIERSGDTRTVDIASGEFALLSPGDIVTVQPIDPSKVIFVSGAVRSSAPLTYRPGMDLSAALSEAGVVPNAGVNHVRVIRNSPTGIVKTTVNMDSKSTPPSFFEMMPGDKVEVPFASAQTSDRQLVVILLVALVIIVIAGR